MRGNLQIVDGIERREEGNVQGRSKQDCSISSIIHGHGELDRLTAASEGKRGKGKRRPAPLLPAVEQKGVETSGVLKTGCGLVSIGRFGRSMHVGGKWVRSSAVRSRNDGCLPVKVKQ